MSQVHEKGAVTPEMNITPLIDVVFLLIVFFMLVNNIVSNELVELIAPDLDEPQTRELGEVPRIVVSVAPRDFNQSERSDDPLMFSPQAQFVQVGSDNQNRFPMGDLEGVTTALEQAKGASEEVEVVLRADTALYYEEVRPVMDAITAAGIGTVNLVAFMPDRDASDLGGPMGAPGGPSDADDDPPAADDAGPGALPPPPPAG